MAFNGSGIFQRLYSWTNDAAANIKIRADRMDNEMNGMATGLSTCITKDGQTTITANLPMAGFKHTGVGDASERNQYASFGQVQDGKSAWVDGGGTADAITATYSVPLTALVDGQLCFVRATAANTTTTPTFSPNLLTPRIIVKNGGKPLDIGDINGDGHELILRYDLANTRWELLNPKGYQLTISGGFAVTLTATGVTNVTLPTTGTLATLASPTFTGTPSAPTAAAGTNTTQLATTAFVNTTVNGTAVTLAANSTAVTQSTGDSSTKVATTAFVTTQTFGYGGQAWTDVTGSRALGTTYTNNTTRPILVVVEGTPNTNGQRLQVTINGVLTFSISTGAGSDGNFQLGQVIIQPGATYNVTTSGGVTTLTKWVELR